MYQIEGKSISFFIIKKIIFIGFISKLNRNYDLYKKVEKKTRN